MLRYIKNLVLHIKYLLDDAKSILHSQWYNSRRPLITLKFVGEGILIIITDPSALIPNLTTKHNVCYFYEKL